MKDRTHKAVDPSDSVHRKVNEYALAAIPDKSIIAGQTCRR
jgi:hypothetical protein